MPITFLTGNTGKIKEIQAIIPAIKSMDLDLPEIQSLDAREVVTDKLRRAYYHHNGEFIVEDTSLYINSLKGLPGPLVKWFLKTVGCAGIATMAEAFGDGSAIAKTIIGYSNNKDDIHFFEGTISGTIVAPRGNEGFGWDPIFIPNGHSETFAEMSSSAKRKISMRQQAAIKLRTYLELQHN